MEWVIPLRLLRLLEHLAVLIRKQSPQTRSRVASSATVRESLTSALMQGLCHPYPLPFYSVHYYVAELFRKGGTGPPYLCRFFLPLLLRGQIVFDSFPSLALLSFWPAYDSLASKWKLIRLSTLRLFWSTLRVPIEASHGFQLTDKRRQQDRWLGHTHWVLLSYLISYVILLQKWGELLRSFYLWRTNAVQLSRRDGGRSTVLSYRYSQRWHSPSFYFVLWLTLLLEISCLVRDTMVYYWSLPRQFLGNKLGAYGGNLTFFQVGMCPQ